MMGRLFAYIRVSTDRQAESGLGLTAQTNACQREGEFLGGEWAMTRFGQGPAASLLTRSVTESCHPAFEHLRLDKLAPLI